MYGKMPKKDVSAMDKAKDTGAVNTADNADCKDETDKIVAMLDGFIARDVSRFKITTDDELSEGEVKETYHHGRCDVGSPWARGCSFDVLESEDD